MVALIVSSAVITGTAGVYQRPTTMKGQIIAYRPAERVSQVASHVLNKEYFLFRVKTSGTNSSPRVIKLMYEHFGYSMLGNDLLSKMPTLQLIVHRDSTCDETYGAFVENSPNFNDDRTKEAAGEKVIFIGSFQEMKPSNEQILKCYKLERIVTR
jgi:hypothetical protein